jgi:hypothetical protein
MISNVFGGWSSGNSNHQTTTASSKAATHQSRAQGDDDDVEHNFCGEKTLRNVRREKGMCPRTVSWFRAVPMGYQDDDHAWLFYP